MAAVGSGSALGVSNDRKQRATSSNPKEAHLERLQRIRQGVYGACERTQRPRGGCLQCCEGQVGVPFSKMKSGWMGGCRCMCHCHILHLLPPFVAVPRSLCDMGM